MFTRGCRREEVTQLRRALVVSRSSPQRAANPTRSFIEQSTAMVMKFARTRRATSGSQLSLSARDLEDLVGKRSPLNARRRRLRDERRGSAAGRRKHHESRSE
ncbi:MAG: hypothetical protein ACI9KE_004494 [Polyangiales bacterium]